MSIGPFADRRAVFDDLAARWDTLCPAGAQDEAVERGLALVGDIEDRVIVDVGCGTGLLESYLVPHLGCGRLLALDSSPAMMARACAKHDDRRIEWLCRDVRDAGIDTASVDVVLCYNTWPHFDDPAGVARELARWLRPGGPCLVWHDIGRDRLAALHAEAGGPIAGDQLPPIRDLAAIFRTSGFVVASAEEDANSYTLLVSRLAETQIAQDGTPRGESGAPIRTGR
jgi:SAM-dependent methyltransferase